jgi:transcription-repair coupling factor (superfamily II helicase)
MSTIVLADRLANFLQGKWRGPKRIQGVQGGARAFVLSLIAERLPRPILIIAPGAREAENIFDDLSFFLGADAETAPFGSRLHLFPSWEVLPFENLSPHPENIAGRLEALYKFVEESAPIVVATPAALMQRVIPRESLSRSYLYLVAGQDLARDQI